MNTTRDPSPIRALDLCCGAGGWACAARGTGIEIVLADYIFCGSQTEASTMIGRAVQIDLGREILQRIEQAESI